MNLYRPGGTRYVAYGCVVVLVVMAIVVTLGLPEEIRTQVVLSQALTLYGTIALMCLILHGIGRSYVRVDEREIEVLNGFRRHVLGWDQVKGFAFGKGAAWPTLVTHDDERVMLFGIQGRGDADEIVRDLVRRVP